MKLFIAILAAGVLCGLTSGVAVKPQSALRKATLDKRVPLNCVLCRLITTVVEATMASITNATSESAMQVKIKKFCMELHIFDKVRSYCGLISTGLAALLWEVQTKKPEAYCQMIRECPASGTEIADLKYRVKEHLASTRSYGSTQRDSVKCMMCQSAFLFFEKTVAKEVNSESQMIQLVDEFCMKWMKSSIECKMISLALGKALWKGIQLSPRKACTQMKLCDDSYSQRKLQGFGVAAFRMPSNDSTECSTCKQVVSTVKVFVIAQEGWIAKEIKSLVCDELPVLPAMACRSAIDNDLPELLEKYIVPEQICELVDLCPKARLLPGFPARQSIL